MRRLLLVLLTLSIVPPAHSAAIYDYTGNPFAETFQDPGNIYDLSDFVTATLLVDDPVVQDPNTMVDAALLPGFSLSMSDETRTLDSNASTISALLYFDADCNLVGWQVRKQGPPSDFIETRNVPAGSVIDQSAQVAPTGVQAQAWVNNNPGSWNGFSTGCPPPTPVPIPGAALVVMALGLAGIGFSTIRRLTKADR